MNTEIDIALVRTEYPSNIGASARAMANLGGNRLILIDPKCKITHKAKQAAAGAQAQLRKRVTYPDWQSFYENEPEGIRIALTRRGGKKRRVNPLESSLKEARRKRKKISKIYLIFGPEADGLDVDDVAFAHQCCHLPVSGEFGSLNLAQAVLLALYITRQVFPPKALPRQTTADMDAVAQEFYFPDDSIREWLTAMGFDVSARKSSAYLTLKKLFLQKFPTKHEMQVLDAILQQNIRKLRK